MYDDLPVLGIYGWSGSGKTTLIEALVNRLRAEGLSVAVVKHDVHGVDLDHAGKDSERLFRAGADVLLQGPKEELLRVPLFLTAGCTSFWGPSPCDMTCCSLRAIRARRFPRSGSY